MNHEQRTRTFFGIVAFIAMAVYPPWVVEFVAPPGPSIPVHTSQVIHNSSDYSWIWEPASHGSNTGARPDLVRLFIQWACVFALFGFWTYCGREQKAA